MATIPCSVIEYVHYSHAIEEKKYCVVLGAIKVHDSLTHCISPFSCMTHHLMLDAPRVMEAYSMIFKMEAYRCPACRQKDEQSSCLKRKSGRT